MDENAIEIVFHEFRQQYPVSAAAEYSKLYRGVKPDRLAELFADIHAKLNQLIESMNSRLPTTDSPNHFWATDSRDLLFVIEIIDRLSDALENTQFDFEIDDYISKVINKCREFLQMSGGSQIPINMARIKIFYSKPIFIQGEQIRIDSIHTLINTNLIQIGSGSYGNIYKFYDSYYEVWFALKRASKTVDNKELERFKNEYKYMFESNSPFIVKVYSYNGERNEYIMELMDFSLDQYYKSRNNNIPFSERKLIGNQIIRAIKYIHSKGLLHRDICPRNVLVKCYDDTVMAKLSDFGLVKTNSSTLTSDQSEIKGSYHDPNLETVGFHNYSLTNEIYALSKTLRFVLTGITNLDRDIKIDFQRFAEKGMSSDISKRYQSIQDVEKAFRELKGS